MTDASLLAAGAVLIQKTPMVTFIPVPTSLRLSPLLSTTTTFMTENSLLSSLPSLNGSTIFKESLTLSLSSLITRTFPTSRTLINYLGDKLAGLYSFRTSTLNGLLPLVLRWALPMLSYARMILTPPLIIMPPPPLSLNPSSSMLLISPFPNPLPTPPLLILSFSASSPPCKTALHCFHAPPSLTGILTMDISTSRIECMFPPLLAPPYSISCIPPPPLAT